MILIIKVELIEINRITYQIESNYGEQNGEQIKIKKALIPYK